MRDHLLHLADFVERLNSAQSFKMRGEFKMHQSAVTQAMLEIAIGYAKDLHKYVGDLSMQAHRQGNPNHPAAKIDLNALVKPDLPEKEVFKHRPMAQ